MIPVLRILSDKEPVSTLRNSRDLTAETISLTFAFIESKSLFCSSSLVSCIKIILVGITTENPAESLRPLARSFL
jgi:hypothetical protein